MRKLGMEELGRKTVEEFRQSAKHSIIIILEDIRSMHNVGSVFRTADAFLAEAIYLCGYTPQPPHRDIHKTALGATETVAWKYFKNSSEALNELRLSGYKIFGVEQTERSQPLNFVSIKKNDKVAVVFGNEVDGVSQEALQLCDASIEIPQWGMKHSLNVSVAAGIVLWELVRENGNK